MKSSKWLLVLLIMYGSICGFEIIFPILATNKFLELILFIIVFRATQINVNELGDLLIDTLIVATCVIGWQEALLAPLFNKFGLSTPPTLLVFGVIALYFQYDRATNIKYFIVSSLGVIVFAAGTIFLFNGISSIGTLSSQLPPLSTMAAVSIGYFLCNVFVSQMQKAPKWKKKPMAVMVEPSDDM